MDEQKQKIEELINRCLSMKDNFTILMVCCVKGLSSIEDDYLEYSVETEYLSISELNYLQDVLSQNEIVFKCFYHANDFFKWILNKKESNKSLSNYVVFDTTQTGTSHAKNTLIPSFCSHNSIKHIGSNTLFNCLSNAKHFWGMLLGHTQISTPKQFTYSYMYGWLIDTPSLGKEYIIKPSYECASIGIDSHSKITYTAESEKRINEISKHFNQPIVIQEFIEGHEVEIPLILLNGDPIILPAVGIELNGEKNLGKSFLSYSLVEIDNYTFYNFNQYNAKLSNELKKIASKIARFLDADKYIRIDVRIDIDENIYITDINCYPHIVNHSSFNYAYSQLFNDEKLLLALIGNVL